MIRWFVLFAWMGFAAHATQETWPALHDVTGVSAEDALNIRAEPNGQADIVGRLMADATSIEVIRPNAQGTWGEVNTGEGSGWVSLRYLERQAGQWDGAFPKVQQCYGTEPFWNLTLAKNALTVRRPDKPETVLTPVWRTSSAQLRNVFAFGAGDTTGFLANEVCNDGMSDRSYGWIVHLVMGDGPGTVMVSGCCSLN